MKYCVFKGNQYVFICFSIIELMWCVMIELWTILVEMILKYWGLKGNQGTMVTYEFICFNMVNWYDVCDGWIIWSNVIILVEIKPEYWILKGNQGMIVTYASICFNMVELIWYVVTELYIYM